MDMEVELTGTDATEETTLSLQDWIRNERIAGLRAERKSGSPKEGELGLEPLTILSVVLAAPAVIQLTKSIHVWLRTRKPSVVTTIRCGGTEIIVDAENIQDEKDFLDKVLAVSGSVGG